MTRRIKTLDSLVLQHIQGGNPALFSKTTIARFSQSSGRKVTTSAIQSSVKKLKNMKVISQYADKYYIESPGFIRYLAS